MRTLPVRPARGGFTLVELLVVIGVISLLVALLLPVVAGAPKRANRLRCASNLGQVYRGARLINQPRAQRFYALLADVFLDEAELPHDAGRLNCVYWDGSAQWVDTTPKPIPWNAVSTAPGETAAHTFSDDLAGYTAVRDAWVVLSELRW